jgi:hypothetical protein
VKIFGMCIDKRVVVGLGLAALVIWWQAPQAFGAALPLLVFAICPLSMLLMMKAMSQMNHQGGSPNEPAEAKQPEPASPAAPARPSPELN